MEGSPSSMLQLSDEQVQDLLYKKLSPYCRAAPGSLRLMIRGLASSCRSLNVMCRPHVEHLRLEGGSADAYKTAISHAVKATRLSSAFLQCRRSSGDDEAPASVVQHLQVLTALRDLHITSNAITAADVRALAELTSLTSLHLQDADKCVPGVNHGSNAASVAELQPLALLTGLQQLSITAWDPQHAQYGSQGAAAAAGRCCLPAHTLTSLEVNDVEAYSVGKWMPSMLACTALQRLQLRTIGGINDRDTHYLLDSCANLTGLTMLQVQLSLHSSRPVGALNVFAWTPPQNISSLQRLQHLQLEGYNKPCLRDDVDVTHACCMVAEADALFRCSALRSLVALRVGDAHHRNPVPAGAVLPHLTKLHIYRQCNHTQWPVDAFPNLQSLHLKLSHKNMPCCVAYIPGSRSITELVLTGEADPPGDYLPESGSFHSMAAALPQLRSLQLVLTVCLKAGRECQVVPWLQSLSTFTQLQQLAVAAAPCAPHNRCSSRHRSYRASVHGAHVGPLVPSADVLLALCKLPQLQQVTLSGWAWDVSPTLVAALQLGLSQLSSIKLEHCCGRGTVQQAKQAAMREEMAVLAAKLRAGVQLQYVE